MPVESSGHERGNPRMFELFESQPNINNEDPRHSPTAWSFPQVMDFLKVSGQPVQGPWPPHQIPRPDPDHESGPTVVTDPKAFTPRSEL